MVDSFSYHLFLFLILDLTHKDTHVNKIPAHTGL